MNYKKLYNEALSRARRLEEKSNGMILKKWLWNVFPELKESEDERIRKELIEFVKSRYGFKQEYIAWLERQGEKETILPKWKYKKDNTPLLRDSIILNKYGGVAKSPSGAIISDAWVLDYDELAKLPKEELEKQGEKKLVWSEEDKRICQCLIKDQEEALDDVRNDRYGHSEIISDLKETYRERIDWLKSIKQRLGG